MRPGGPWFPSAQVTRCQSASGICAAIAPAVCDCRAPGVHIVRNQPIATPYGWSGKAYGADLNRIYNASRLILNGSHSNDVNMRYFEGQATGVPLLTDRVDNGETELFNGLLLWRDLAELERLAQHLLDNPDHAEEVGQAQLATVRERHTYLARARDILTAVHARFGLSDEPCEINQPRFAE